MIGVVVPSDLAPVADASYGMGEAVERPAPSPVVEVVTSVSTTSSPTSTSTTSVVYPTINPLKSGNRFIGYGNVVIASSSSTSPQPVAAMGAPVSRKKIEGKITVVNRRHLQE